MLVLTRKVGENDVTADNIRVATVRVKGDRVRMASGPPEVIVDRLEVRERRQECEGPVVIVAPTDPCHPKAKRLPETSNSTGRPALPPSGADVHVFEAERPAAPAA